MIPTFIAFIEKEISKFLDEVLSALYLVDKKYKNNNIINRSRRIVYLVKQIKDANFQLYNELKSLHQEMIADNQTELENQKQRAKKNAKLLR